MQITCDYEGAPRLGREGWVGGVVLRESKKQEVRAFYMHAALR